METLNTLNTLIDDILEEIRSNNITESESVSRIQIEQWIHQYRSLLIKQDLDKGRYTNPSYIQSVATTITQPTIFKTTYSVFSAALPNTIDLHYKSGVTNVRGIDGEEIQLMPRHRVIHNLNRRYVNKKPVASLYNNQIQITLYGTDIASYTVYVDGIFEDPSMVSGFSADAVYPIPANMIPTLKELIFKKEFGLMLTTPTDTNNNSYDDLKNINAK